MNKFYRIMSFQALVPLHILNLNSFITGSVAQNVADIEEIDLKISTEIHDEGCE
jgi:hypothetical protein